MPPDGIRPPCIVDPRIEYPLPVRRKARIRADAPDHIRHLPAARQITHIAVVPLITPGIHQIQHPAPIVAEVYPSVAEKIMPLRFPIRVKNNFLAIQQGVTARLNTRRIPVTAGLHRHPAGYPILPALLCTCKIPVAKKPHRDRHVIFFHV